MEPHASAAASPASPQTTPAGRWTHASVARPGRLAELGIGAILRSERVDALALPLQRALRRLATLPGWRRAKDVLNGTWLGHPLHPALTDVPIGAWTTALVFDALTVVRRSKLDRGAGAAVFVGVAGATASSA